MNNRLIIIATLLMSLALSVPAGAADSGLIYSGPYTATGTSYSYNTGQYANSGVSAVNYVEIYYDRLVVNGKSYEKWNADGQWLWYGHNTGASNHPAYLFNTATYELRWRFIFDFFGLQISDNFWVMGNQMTQGGSSGSSGYDNNYGSSSSPGRTPHRCGLCGGKGWVPTDEGVATYGSSDKKYCNECGQWVYTGHWHKTCPSCQGKGEW